MRLCLFEDDHVASLRPLVETRAAYDLRLGGRTLLQTTVEAVPEATGGPVLHARAALRAVTAQRHPNARVAAHNRVAADDDASAPAEDAPDARSAAAPSAGALSSADAGVLYVNGRLVADGPAWARIRATMAQGGGPRLFVHDEAATGTTVAVAAWLPGGGSARPALAPDALAADALTPATFGDLPAEALPEADLVGRLWHLLDALTPALHRDIAARTGGAPARGALAERPGADVHPSVVAVRPAHIHLAPGVTVKAGAVLSAEDGPIYLDAGATVHEQAVVRGPLYLGPHGHVRIGANVATAAFGPHTKVGGEVHSTLVQGYSNKAHAGFLGHSLLGQWCNLGADTNNSNLKNDYGPVSLYHAPTGTFEDTGRQFVGLVMGDHGKAGINTMFNTGTVVGTCCNVYGGGFPPRALPPFAWGSPAGGFATYRLAKALRVAEAVMARRDTPLTPADRALLTHVFEATADERVWG